MTVLEGILGCFYMDTDILSSLYYDIHNQQWPIGDMIWVPQHMSVLAWKRAIDKFIIEICDIILGHYICCIMKMGWIYLGCLCQHGYIDYVFPLLPDDHHANQSLVVMMAADAVTMVMYQQPQSPVPTVQAAPQAQAVAQPALGTTGPDVVIEEIIKIVLNDDDDNNNNEWNQAAADEENTIFSMIQVYKEVNTPPQAPETPCQICIMPREASAGKQSTDMEIMNAAMSLLLSYPAPAEMALSSQMSQWLGLAPGTLPNLEQNLQESISPSKKINLDHLRDKYGHSRWDLSKVWSEVREYKKQESKVEETDKDWSRWNTERSSSKQSQSKQRGGSLKCQSESRWHSQSRDTNASD